MRINFNKNLVQTSLIMSSLSHQPLNNLVSIKRKDSRNIAFIDSSIKSCEDIVQDVIPQARAIIIGSEDDGVRAIGEILNDSNCSEIHIFSSGFPGCIYLGNSELSIDSFDVYRRSLKSWFNNYDRLNSRSRPSYIHIYSYNLNVGDVGEEFVKKLNQITGAQIRTSVNILNSTILQTES